MIYSLILFPLAMAAAAFALPSNRWRPWLLPAGGVVAVHSTVHPDTCRRLV